MRQGIRATFTFKVLRLGSGRRRTSRWRACRRCFRSGMSAEEGGRDGAEFGEAPLLLQTLPRRNLVLGSPAGPFPQACHYDSQCWSRHSPHFVSEKQAQMFKASALIHAHVYLYTYPDGQTQG